MIATITGMTGCGHYGICNCMPQRTSSSRIIWYGGYFDQPPEPRSRRERELRKLQEQFRSEHRDLKRGRLAQKLEGRLAEQQREKQATLDKLSRSRSAPAATRKKDTRRLQTFDAAMHERQIRR